MSNALAISVQSWRYLRPFQDSSLLSTMKSSPPDLVGSFWSPVGIRKARVHQRAAGCNEFDLRAASPGCPLGAPLMRRRRGGGAGGRLREHCGAVRGSAVWGAKLGPDWSPRLGRRV